MRAKAIFALMAVCLMVSGCGGDGGVSTGSEQASPADIEADYAVIDELYDDEASDQEKLAASVAFLEKYPESDHTLGLVGDVLYFRGQPGRRHGGRNRVCRTDSFGGGGS